MKQKHKLTKIHKSCIASAIILFGLLLVFILLRKYLNWPAADTEKTVLTGIFIFSLMPFIINLVDIVIERGGKIEYGDFKIDFSHAPGIGLEEFTMPVNIGVTGQPVNDSGTSQILDALASSITSEIVVIDLEDGHAWWETRLLVLLAGAVRLGKPKIIVFIGRNGGNDRCFLGWAYPENLLNALIKTNKQYSLSYYKSLAASKQWDLVEPNDQNLFPYQVPNLPVFIQPGLATQHPWMAFDSTSGLPNKLYAEQLLASDLGMKFEETPIEINLSRLEELFKPILIRVNIDENWLGEEQMKVFLNNDQPYIVVTNNKQYVNIVARWSFLNFIMKKLIQINNFNNLKEW